MTKFIGGQQARDERRGVGGNLGWRYGSMRRMCCQWQAARVAMGFFAGEALSM